MDAAEVALRQYLLDETPYPERYMPHVIMAPYFMECSAPFRHPEIALALLKGGSATDSSGNDVSDVGFQRSASNKHPWG